MLKVYFINFLLIFILLTTIRVSTLLLYYIVSNMINKIVEIYYFCKIYYFCNSALFLHFMNYFILLLCHYIYLQTKSVSSDCSRNS